MSEVKILSKTKTEQQTTTAYQIENRVFITESIFNPNGTELSNLLIPLITNQQDSAALRTQETTEN